MPGLVSYQVLSDSCPEDRSFSPFTVSTERGFLPRDEPIVYLPSDFDVLESILSRMPIKTADGSPGLLAMGMLKQTVEKELPDFSDTIDKYKHDLSLMTALYRDYSFLASAYLLEPCHLRHVKGECYGLGRDVLPKNIAMPIVKVAKIAGFKPFMEYAGSYALYNYRLEDESQGLDYPNLRLIRAFEHGLDPSSSEAGFVLVHVDMVQHSGLLVSGVMDTLTACVDRDRERFNDGMASVVTALKQVNLVMHKMWNKSRPGDYTTFRTFIFGIAKQSMFPNGIIYEGYDNDNPQFFRGESGANDSMIPLSDNLLQISMPETPLTEILQDFRAYRPGNHREFLEWVQTRASQVGVKSYALEDPMSSALYLKALNQVRDFRWRHWCFTKEYILRHTKHATATGGSPIVTWLPNQLQAVLNQMIDVEKYCTVNDDVSRTMELVNLQSSTLQKEVAKYREERGE